MSGPCVDTPTEYDNYLDHRKTLVENQAQDARSLTKHVLSLSSGAVAVSIIFLQNLVPNAGPEFLELLLVSWVGLVVCIGTTLLNLMFADGAYEASIEEWDALQDRDQLAKQGSTDRAERLRKRVTKANWVSCVAFIVGVFFLCAFAAVNLRVAKNQIGGFPNEQSAAQTEKKAAGEAEKREDRKGFEASETTEAEAEKEVSSETGEG